MQNSIRHYLNQVYIKDLKEEVYQIRYENNVIDEYSEEEEAKSWCHFLNEAYKTEKHFVFKTSKDFVRGA